MVAALQMGPFYPESANGRTHLDPLKPVSHSSPQKEVLKTSDDLLRWTTPHSAADIMSHELLRLS